MTPALGIPVHEGQYVAEERIVGQPIPTTSASNPDSGARRPSADQAKPVDLNINSAMLPLYLQYYSKLVNQMNLLTDSVRTRTYQRAVLGCEVFKGKVVMDVGAGSGILSYFSAQASARKVIAVEASNAASAIHAVLASNPTLARSVRVINAMVEDVKLTENAEPIGGMFFGPSSLIGSSIEQNEEFSSVGSVPVDTSGTSMSDTQDGIRHIAGNMNEAEMAGVEEVAEAKGLRIALNEEPAEDQRLVDILISEPIGTFLFNERMIESYIYARERFLKPKTGRMFPDGAVLYLSLFSDSKLYDEVLSKVAFWDNQNFLGINLKCLYGPAFKQVFQQPILDFIPSNTLVGQTLPFPFDFMTLKKEELLEMTHPIRTGVDTATVIHGVAGWFDVTFSRGANGILCTGPSAPPTHWHQIRFLLTKPLAVNPGQLVVGQLHMIAHENQSYFVQIDLTIEGTDITTSSEKIDLKDPDYRWYSAAPTDASVA